VIRSFHDKDTQALYEGRWVRRFVGIAAQAERRLQILDSATSLQDLAALPRNRLEALKGDRKGQHSIRINDQGRICFEWHVNGPYRVAVVDYH